MNPLDYVKKTPYELYIDGKYVPAEKGKVVDVINPANNEPFAQVYRGTVEDGRRRCRLPERRLTKAPGAALLPVTAPGYLPRPHR